MPGNCDKDERTDHISGMSSPLTEATCSTDITFGEVWRCHLLLKIWHPQYMLVFNVQCNPAMILSDVSVVVINMWKWWRLGYVRESGLWAHMGSLWYLVADINVPVE